MGDLLRVRVGGSSYLCKWDPNFVVIGGRKYKTVKIGSQIWMAENLRYENEHFFYPNNDPSNLELGLLYQYYYVHHEIVPILPTGWRVPTKNDGLELVNTIGSNPLSYLSASEGGTDNYGFNANLPGMVNSSGNILGFQDGFYFWYQDIKDQDPTRNFYTMWNFKLNKTNNQVEYDNSSDGNPDVIKTSAMTVRLVKDAA